MKKFSRVLAIVLALITVFTTLPISTLADSWLDVETEALPSGDGSVVTVTLDAKALASLLQEEGLSKDTLTAILADANVDTDELFEVFSPEDLFAIVPSEKILELFDLEVIIEKIGLAKLSTYIDIPTLLAGCDKAALADLLKSVPELHKYADVERLIEEGYIPNQVILDNIKKDELEKAVKDIDPNSVIPAVLGLPTFADIQKVIRVYDMVLTDGIIAPTDVMDTAAVETLAEQLFHDPAFNVNSYIDCVYEDDAIAYFKDKYEHLDPNNTENLKTLRDMIKAGYLEIGFEYHVDSVDLVKLIDNGFLDPAEVEHDVHDYLVSVFSAMSSAELEDYANKGVFSYTVDAITGNVEVTNVDIHKVLDENIVTVQELRANCPVLEQHMEDKIDEWTHDDEKLDLMIELDCMEVTILEWHVESVNYQLLMQDGYLTSQEILDNDLVDVNKLALALIEDGLIEIDEDLIDDAKLKAKIETIDPAVLVGYVNAAEFVDAFGTQQVIDWLGGFDKAMACINVPGVTEDIMSILSSIMEKLAENGVPVTDVIYLDQLLAKLDFMAVVELIGINNILAQLDNSEMIELLKVADLKAHMRDLLLLFYNYGMKNIDKIALNGQVVAEQDYTDLLKFDAGVMLQVLDSMIPTLDELAELDTNVLASLDVEMEYLPEDGVDTVKKHIVFEFALAGGSEDIAKAASKLRDMLSNYVNDMTLSLDSVIVDVTVPNKFGEGYLALLESDKIPESVKEKLITVPDMNGDEMIAFINDELTLEDLNTILSAIEPSEVFEKVKNSAFVEAVLAKLGKNVPNVTLDDVWDALNTKDITVENICKAVEKVTKRDVMALLEAGAPKVDGFVDRAEEIAQIQSLLAKVESKLGIDVSDISVEEILNRDANVNLVDKIAEVVGAKIGVDIRTIMASYTPDELWAKAIEKATEREDIYNKVRNYLILKLDKIPDKLMALSIADFYKGDGVFGAAKTAEIDTKATVEKLLTKLLGNVEDPQVQAAIELLMTRFEESVLPVEVSVTARFENLYRITFMDRNGAGELFSAFLPTGTDLSIYKYNPDVTDFEFAGWKDENGVEIQKMPNRDVTVYVVADTITLTFVDTNGNLITELTTVKGFSFTHQLLALQAVNETALLLAPALGANDALLYTPWRVLWNAGSTVIDLEKSIGLETVFNTDTTLVVDFAREYLLYFSDPSVDYDVTYADGVYTVTVHDEFAQEYSLNIKDLLPKATADATVALKLVIEEADIVLAEIKNATLKSLDATTASDACVWFRYKENAAVTDAFAGTFYEGKNLPSYSFAFLTSEATDASDAQSVTADFGGETVQIQLPYANAATNTEYMTRVYAAANGKREYAATTVVRNGVIGFALESFADVVISDEYRLTIDFYPAISGSLSGNYADANGDLYFPADAKFDLFFDLPGNYEVDFIIGDDGTVYDYGEEFTMPATNKVLTIMIVVDIVNTVTLTFKDQSGKVVGSLEIPKGSSFLMQQNATYLKALNSVMLANSPAISGDDAKVFGSWRVIWMNGAYNQIDQEKNIGLNIPFYSDTTLTLTWGKNYLMYFSDPSVNYEVTYDQGLYTVTVYSSFAKEYNLNIKDLLPKAASDDTVALKLVIAQKDIVLADIANATLKSLHAVSAEDAGVWFKYATNNAVTDAFAGTFYEGKNLPCYSFGFVATSTSSYSGARAIDVDFGGAAVKIQLPYANAVSSEDYMTRVYTVENGVRKYLNTTVVSNGVIEFAMNSFTDIVISDEYRLTVEFMPAIAGALLGGYADESGALFFPAGAQFALNFEIADGYILDKVIDSAQVEYAAGDVFTMPEAAQKLTVYTHFTGSKQFHIYYYYFDPVTGELKQAADTYSYYTEAFDATLALNPGNVSADALNAVLPGYNKNEYRWSELDQSLVGVADISLFMIRIPITYTVQFTDEKDGSLISTLEGLTAENADQLYKLPALPAGVTAWTVVRIERPTDLTDPAQNVITVVLSGTVETKTYEIVHGANVSDETPRFAGAGETVNVKVEERFGYTAEIVVKNAAGETVEVVNGSFTMPAMSVFVNVLYKPATISYTINKVPGSGYYMDTVTFEVVLKRGEKLASISEECVPVSTVMDGDKTVLTYAFVLDGEKAITYKVERAKSIIDRIFNGTLFDDGFFPEYEGDAIFEVWSEPFFNALSFAMFSSPEEEECSPVWCWILIILAVLIVAVVVLCILGTKGIIVPGLTFLATCVANGFFWLCILLANFGKKIVSLFKK